MRKLNLITITISVCAALALCLPSATYAAPILSIDFSGAELNIEIPMQPGTDTPLQPGYVGWAGPYFGNPGSD